MREEPEIHQGGEVAVALRNARAGCRIANDHHFEALFDQFPQMRFNAQIGVGTQNGPRYTLRFCRAFDGAHLAKRSERGGWRIGIGPEVIAGEIDMLPTER